MGNKKRKNFPAFADGQELDSCWQCPSEAPWAGTASLAPFGPCGARVIQVGLPPWRSPLHRSFETTRIPGCRSKGACTARLPRGPAIQHRVPREAPLAANHSFNSFTSEAFNLGSGSWCLWHDPVYPLHRTRAASLAQQMPPHQAVMAGQQHLG